MPAALDPYSNYADAPDFGGTLAVAIVPADGADLATAVRRIWVGTTGDLAVVTVGGSTATFKNVPVGLFAAVRVARVLATGTTASNLVGVQ